jgi:hypothetical protein
MLVTLAIIAAVVLAYPTYLFVRWVCSPKIRHWLFSPGADDEASDLAGIEITAMTGSGLGKVAPTVTPVWTEEHAKAKDTK